MTTLIHPPRVNDAMKKLNHKIFFDMLRHARRIKSKGYTKKERYCFYFGFWWGQEHKFESFPQLIDAVSEALGKGEYDGLSSINTK